MTARSRLPLNALRVLEAVGRQGSLAAAAEVLHVEPSAVSMQMKSLADYVGAPLLRRVGRGVELTDVAKQLLPAVAAGLDQIDAALRAARHEQCSEFRLSVLPSLLLLWMLPRMSELIRLSDSQGLSLAVSASKSLVDLRAGEADAAIRLGAGKWPGLVAEKLMYETLVPVCAPALARRVGTVDPGQAPRGVTLLGTRLDSWARWGEIEPSTSTTLTIEDAAGVVMAAERGLGVALARGVLAEAALRDGRLVQVGPHVPYRHAYYWVSIDSADAAGLGERLARALRRVSDFA